MSLCVYKRERNCYLSFSIYKKTLEFYIYDNLQIYKNNYARILYIYIIYIIYMCKIQNSTRCILITGILIVQRVQRVRTEG